MTWSVQDFAEAAGVFRREMAGAVRRFVIGRSDGGVWQVLGHLLFDPTKRETKDVENYPGIGVFARPPDGAGEGIVVQAGGPNNPALIAARDEATRAKVNDVAPDETAIYNSAARVHVKANGTIEARTHSGTAEQLAMKSAIDGFFAILNGWTPVPNDGGAALKTAFTTYVSGNPGWPKSTTKLKGE